MNISVFGMGYVGVVTSACLARDGFRVIGVDINEEKVAMINSGREPIIEDGLASLIADGVASGGLSATTSAAAAVQSTDVSLICVGTPSMPNGGLDDQAVRRVCQQIGREVAAKDSPHVTVVRSTVLPGTTEACAELIREASGSGASLHHVAFNPEFLREGSAIRDYDSPAYTIIGTDDAAAEKALRAIYRRIDAPFVVTDVRVAEMIKYAANSWHAVKITFANEIGRIAKAVGVDGREIMDIIVRDTRLNISPAYLRPGFAYGGSCLPKDLRAITHFARVNSIHIPLLESLESSNRSQIELALAMVQATGAVKVGMLGLAFKAGTDDLRESPAVELAERLIGKGFDLKILDTHVNEAKLIGANREYIETHIAHLSSLLTSDPDIIKSHAEVIVICNETPEFRELTRDVGADIPVLDLVGLFKNPPPRVGYHGIAW